MDCCRKGGRERIAARDQTIQLDQELASLCGDHRGKEINPPAISLFQESGTEKKLGRNISKGPGFELILTSLSFHQMKARGCSLPVP